MPRITRKELKTDKFALEVEQTVTFFEEHRQEIIRYAGIGLAAVVLIAGYMVYRSHQHSAREEALTQALQVKDAPVGPAAPGAVSFSTPEAKEAAVAKAFTDLENKYSGSAEALIAQYYLAAAAADQGKLAEAEKGFLQVSQKGDAQYSSLAKLSLAQIYFSDGRTAQGESILRDLMAHPTIFVSKDQATLTLARYLIVRNPDEARRLLDPYRTMAGSVGQVALSLYSELPAK